MLKTLVKSFSLIVILSLFIFMAPVSLADNPPYGTLTGSVLDKNGNPIGNATVDVRDWSGYVVASEISTYNGTFEFDQIPITGADGRDTFSIFATYNVSNKTYTDKTIYFWIYKNQVVDHDVVIYSYPPSGSGWLTGNVVEANNIKNYLTATVYLNNGMYTFVTNNPGDHWQFYLPEGDYTAWAEHNENGRTYISDKTNVHVNSDDTYTDVITISLTGNGSTYHAPPAIGVNVVHGSIIQKNNVPLYGANVELCRLNGHSFDPIMVTSSNIDGNFKFDNVNVSTVMENYVVRLTYNYNGSDYTKVSNPITIYYNNMLNVSHDYSVPMAVDFVDSGSLEIITNPYGAEIWVDGADSGRQSPFNFTGLKAGEHTISLLMDGYLPENLTARVSSENTTMVNKVLSKSTGDVYFDVHPSDASIYVNGELAGQGSMNLTNIHYGKYSYMVSRDGYWNVTGTFEVLPGGNYPIPVDLVAVPGLSFTYVGYLIDNILGTMGKII